MTQIRFTLCKVHNSNIPGTWGMTRVLQKWSCCKHVSKIFSIQKIQLQIQSFSVGTQVFPVPYFFVRILSWTGMADYLKWHMILTIYPKWRFLKKIILFYRKKWKIFFNAFQLKLKCKKIRFLEKPVGEVGNHWLWYS